MSKSWRMQLTAGTAWTSQVQMRAGATWMKAGAARTRMGGTRLRAGCTQTRVLMRPHIAYMHNEPCATLARHFLRRCGTICAQGRQRMTRDDTFCDHLRCLIPFYNTLQCSISLLRPFLTFSDTFRPFATFLDFALFNTPPNCVAFSGTFHQTLFTWLVHHSFGFSGIMSVRLALRFTDISCFILLL